MGSQAVTSESDRELISSTLRWIASARAGLFDSGLDARPDRASQSIGGSARSSADLHALTTATVGAHHPRAAGAPGASAPTRTPCWRPRSGFRRAGGPSCVGPVRCPRRGRSAGRAVRRPSARSRPRPRGGGSRASEESTTTSGAIWSAAAASVWIGVSGPRNVTRQPRSRSARPRMMSPRSWRSPEGQASSARGPAPRSQPRARPSSRARRRPVAKCSCATEASPSRRRSPSARR